MPDPRQLEFWSKEELRAWNLLAPLMLEILFAGGRSGHDMLPGGIQIMLDWDTFNEAAVAYLREYRMGIFGKVNEYTRTRVATEIENWIRGGEHIDVLKARLTPLFSKERAKRIAVTEVTRLYADANQMAWKATGFVDRNRWNTAKDEKVCPICRPLHGMEVALGQNAFTTEAGGLGITGPPAHVNCRCWLSPVVSVEGFDEAQRRRLALA